MSYLNETFVFSAKDELSGTLASVKLAAENAGVSVSDFGRKIAESVRGENELKALRGELKSLNEESEKASKNVDSLNSGFRENTALAANLSMVFKGVGDVLSKIGGALAKPFRELSRFEDVAARLNPVVGGLDKARSLAEKLRLEAANGVLDFERLATIAGRLGSVFSSTADVEKWTGAFHNLAAGTGMNVDELVSNFVKAKASGRFEGGFLDMFAQKGVNVFEELEKQSGKPAEAFRKLAAEGRLSFSEVEQAILALSTGTGKFANAAADMSNTLGGSFATLAAHWDIFLAKLAVPLGAVFKPLIVGATRFVEVLQTAADTKIGLLGFALSGISASVAACAGGWKAFTGAIRTASLAVRAFGTASKAALAGTGIGALVVAAAAAYEFFSGKAADAAEKLKEDVDDLGRSAAGLKDRFDAAADERALESLRRSVAQEEDAWRERLDAYEEGSEEYKTFAAEFEAWKRAAAEHALAAEKRIEAKKLAERAKAHAEEIAQMRERSDALRAEIDREKREMLLASSLPRQKIQFTLSFAKVGSARELEEELRALAEASHLTKEQELRARELLDAKKKIAAVEREAESVRAGLREKISLLQAELEGNEKLLELKEQIRRAELREQFAKALPGASPEQVEEQLRKYLELEKAVEDKRRAQKAEKALQEELVELERKRLRAAGDDAALKAFDARIAAAKKYKALLEADVDAATALEIARRNLEFDSGETLAADVSAKPFAAFEKTPQTQTLDAKETPGANVRLDVPELGSLALGAQKSADSALAVAANKTAENTGAILAEIRRRRSENRSPAFAVFS